MILIESYSQCVKIVEKMDMNDLTDVVIVMKLQII